MIYNKKTILSNKLKKKTESKYYFCYSSKYNKISNLAYGISIKCTTKSIKKV